MAEYKQIDLQIGTETQFESKKETLPIGTFVGITDPIHKSELDSNLQASINSIANKLDKPTGEITEDSVPVISSTGTVSAKPLSELGGKLYLHKVDMTTTWEGFGEPVDTHLELYNTSSTKYTLDTLIAKLKNKGTFNCLSGTLSIDYRGIRFEDSGSNVSLILDETPFTMKTSRIATIGNGVTIDSFNDDPMEI